MAGKFDGYSSGNSLVTRFVKSRTKRKNVGWARPTANFNGGPCPPYVNRGVLEQLESRILLSTFTVTSVADDGGANELRWAIQQANLGGTNTINFKSGLTGTITLTKGQLELSSGNTTITGPGASSLTISGNKLSRVFLIDASVTGNISGLTIANGLAATIGGGIENDGTLTLTNCTVSGNAATNTSSDYTVSGGGIYSAANTSLNLAGCTVSSNKIFRTNFGGQNAPDAGGGGIYSRGTTTVSNTTFSANSAGYNGDSDNGTGGGIENTGTLKVSNCIFSNNSTSAPNGSGGALHISGTATVSGSTFTGNSSLGVGAIYVDGSLMVTGSAFTNNVSTATVGSGTSCIGSGGSSGGMSLAITGCTFSGNSVVLGKGGCCVVAGTYATVSNCTFTDNTGAELDLGRGGSVTDCTFMGNNDRNGGYPFSIIAIAGGTMTDCTISGNTGVGISTSIRYVNGYASTTTIIDNCTISGNSDTGVVNSSYPSTSFISTLDIIDSTISGNSSNRGGGFVNNRGGGVINTGNGALNITDSVIAGNYAPKYGGGLLTAGSSVTNINGCTFSGNTAGGGGGAVYNGRGSQIGLLTITNSTFNGNKTNGPGGAIYSNWYTPVVITNCTIADNSAPLGGGILINPYGNTTLFNTIVADNTSVNNGVTTASDIKGTLDLNLAGKTPSSNNLISTGTGLVGVSNDANGNMIGVTAAQLNLGPLQNNGGPTQTMALLSGSLAIGNGNNSLALDASGNPLTTDQRGGSFARIYGGTVDIGAFEYQPTPPKLVYHTQPGTTSAGSAINPAVVVYVEDSTGNILTSDNSAVTLSLLTGSLNGTVTVNAVNGVATFSNLLIYTAGTYTLHAADGTIPAINSNAFTANPAAGAKLVFAAEPTNANAGTNLTPPVVVYEMDAFGNIVRTDTSKVNLSVQSGPGTISGTASVALNNGAAIFSSVSFNTAGTYTLIAQDGSLASIVSTSFQIAATQAQYHLVFAAGPTNTPAGQVLNPSVVVYLMDSQNNIIRNDTSKVTLSVTTGPGTIAGTTSVAFNNGAAIFSNISFPTAGTYTITAKDGSFTSITSASFTISPVTTQVAHLVFVQNPTNIIAGKNIAPNITVKATDASGKVVGGVTVTLEISSGPSGGALFGKWTSTTYATGIAAFGATTLHLAGTYTLTASVGGVVSAKSVSFTVSPAAANKLAFTSLPTSAAHGSAFTVKVSVEDTYGNALTNQNTGTITLGLATHPTGSTLGGTLTANVVNGVATFINLSVNFAGTYTLQASDNFGVGAATSSSIVVS